MAYNYKEFINNIIVEELHPELQEIVKSSSGIQTNENGYPIPSKTKQSRLSAKIRELTNRGESTGIEGNMPRGSSRAYLQHDEPQEIILDGKPTKIKSGMKVAIRSGLDKYHVGLDSLGVMQNEVENGDWVMNKNHRILTETDNPGEYETNEDGIFPPLFEHDNEHHEWSHVGHTRDLKRGEFEKLTKTESHPNGITHREFVNAMNRFHERANGRYWERSDEAEKKLDKVDEHPLVQNFQRFHGNWGSPAYDYGHLKNMGVFEHPNGSSHIVARDAGYNAEVAKAYQKARIRKAGLKYN